MMSADEKQLMLDVIDKSNHEQILKSIQVLMSMPHGKRFIKYLFDAFSVGKMPPVGIYGEMLIDQIAYYRAGNSIYQICLEAAPELTGSLIAETIREKEKQNELKDE